MDAAIRSRFQDAWSRYFPGADLPMAFYYTDREEGVPLAPATTGWRCMLADLGKVARGESVRFDVDHLGCDGGQRYLGFKEEVRPDFEYFLSCGIPGEMEGERYKKSPELVRELTRLQVPHKAPARYLVFKRWDRLAEADQPVAVVFLALPDVLSGLFTLANFDSANLHEVIAPFASGCGSIVYYPYREAASAQPRGVLGMFDVSARPFVPANTLSFAVPWARFMQMVDNMDESFLTTRSWGHVRKRLGKEGASGT
jgi:hypothetical protein